MELNEKLQELRRKSELTQEQLAEKLFVSRTAISKWESGRGYPSIDSLKTIADFFNITIDELLSSKELFCVAQKDKEVNSQQVRDLIFGLLDLSFLLLVFLPLFGQKDAGYITQASLLTLSRTPVYVKLVYFITIAFTAVFGVLLLTLQNCDNEKWIKIKSKVSLILSALSVLIFIATLEPYAAAFSFVLLIIKNSLLLKRL